MQFQGYGSVGVTKFDKACKSIFYSFFINNYSECRLVWFFDLGIDLCHTHPYG